MEFHKVLVPVAGTETDKEVVELAIGNASFDDDDLPRDFWEKKIPEQINSFFNDENHRQEMINLIQSCINEVIKQIITDTDSDIWQKLSENDNLTQVMNQELNMALKDRKVLVNLQGRLKERLKNDSRLVDAMLNQFFGKMAELFVQKMIGPR